MAGMLKWLAKKYGIKACFIAGTLVATPAGAAAIESLQVGDAILALDPDTGQVAEQRVTKLLTRETPRYLDLRLERTDASVSQDLGVTAEHPFWTSEGWRHAAELEPGDLVLSASSGWLRVAGATWVQERTTVHNLEVSGPHTYAAGPLAAWVHNGCGQPFSQEKRALVEMAKRDKRSAITEADMQAYKELNDGLPDPFPEGKVRGPERHPDRPHGQEWHGHVGPVDHIPIVF